MIEFEFLILRSYLHRAMGTRAGSDTTQIMH